MIPLINYNLHAIQAACKEHHIKSLYLIGSAVNENNFSDESDIDFLYRFNKEDIEEMEYADNYFSLLFHLENLLKRKIDLVPEEKIKNPFFIERINKQKLKLYES